MINRPETRIFLTLLSLILFSIPCHSHPSWGIVVDRHGQVYFSDATHNAIWRVDTLGRLSRLVSGKHAHDLFMDAKGFLYAEHVEYLVYAKRWRSSLWRISVGGNMTEVFPPSMSGKKFWYPFTFDSSGILYACFLDSASKESSPLMKRYTDGTISTWNLKDSSGDAVSTSNVGAMAWGPDGALYATSSNKVLRITKDGIVAVVASGLGLKKYPGMPAAGLWGLAVDARKNIYVADYGARRILKITTDGTITTLLNSDSPWSPTGVTISSDDVYILEDGFTSPKKVSGPRVRKVTKNGTISILAVVEEK